MKQWCSGVLVVALALVACGGGGTEPTQNNQQSTGGGGGGGGGTGGPATSATVSIGDNFFAPSSVTIVVGGTVTWNWGGYDSHNVTFAGGAIAGSATKSSGSYEATFSTKGTFSYSCTRHAGMDGTIIVQ